MKIPIAAMICGLCLAGFDASGTAWAQLRGTAYSNAPDGKGDPLAITCRLPQKQPGLRLLGPEVCKTNAVWARYAKDGMEVSADGLHDVPAEKFRTLNPRACRPATMGGGGTSNAMTTNFSMICD